MRLAAALASIVLAGSLLTAAPAEASAPTGDVAGSTTITMRVLSCDGCLIRPALLRIDADGKAQTYWGTQVKVRNGVATMTVPTAKTGGMSFLIQGPKVPRINAQPVIVTQYKGHADGSVVTRAEARAAAKATGCWVGTSASAVTLTVQTMRVRMVAFPPGTGRTTVVTGWLVPTVRASSGNFDASIKGVLATQNGGWPCNTG